MLKYYLNENNKLVLAHAVGSVAALSHAPKGRG